MLMAILKIKSLSYHLGMNKVSKNEYGFGVVEGLLIVIVILLISFIGYYVWHASKTTDKDLTSSTIPATGLIDGKNTRDLKTYTNTNYGFSFQYPTNWVIKEDWSDIGRGMPEGGVSVTSPNLTKVVFDANLGGKGGDCADEQANDQHTTRTCYTEDILKLDKFSSGISGRTLYIYQAKITAPTVEGGGVTYELGMVDNAFYTPELGSRFTDIVLSSVSPGNGELNIRFSGKDDSKNTSASFFDTDEVKEAVSILKTLRLHQ